MEVFYPYLIAALIGFLVGLEREKSHPTEKALGVRTFLLLALLGAVAGGIDSSVRILLGIFSLTLILISHIKSQDKGLTTEIAAALIFSLGFLAHSQPVLSAVMGPLVALVLIAKRSLHGWSEDLKIQELQAAILLMLLASTVSTVLPDRTVDPWLLFNPHQFGYIVLILAGLEFFSYVLIKVIGFRFGTLLTGLLGGLVSSTAVTLSLARSSANKEMDWKLALGTAAAALIGSLMELVVLIAMVSLPLLKTLLPAIGTAVVLAAPPIYFLARARLSKASLKLRSPLDVVGAFRLAILLMAILTVVAIAKDKFGSAGVVAMSLLTGLFELHGLSMATATMHKYGQIETTLAFWSLIIAVESSLLAKTSLVWTFGSRPLAVRYTLTAFAIGAGTLITAWLTSPID